MSVTISRLTVATLPAVERIYVDALPAGERKPVAWLRSLATEPSGSAAGSYEVLVAEQNEPVGFAIVFVPVDPADAALLEYLAVAADARGGGVGGRLFAAAIAAAGIRPLLVEVESDDPDADRRRAFYRRHGCRELVGLHYTLPLPGAPPMGLMVGGVDVVGRPDLSRWLRTVFADVYGQPRDDPRLATIMAGASDPVELL